MSLSSITAQIDKYILVRVKKKILLTKERKETNNTHWSGKVERGERAREGGRRGSECAPDPGHPRGALGTRDATPSRDKMCSFHETALSHPLLACHIFGADACDH